MECEISELEQLRRENQYIQRVATILVRHNSGDSINTTIVSECAAAFDADAVCLFLSRPDDQYEMVAEMGCTQHFKEKCHRIPKQWLPLLLKDNPHDSFFLGTADEFKKESVVPTELVDYSRRESVAYAPLVVNQNPIGIIGFSYNKAPVRPIDPKFVTTLANLFAQAIERVRLFEQEQHARQEAEDANHAKTNFLANISHEIRTPLTAIKGFADLIASSPGLTSEQKHWTDRIIKNSRHLTALIGDILDISKIEADAVEVNRCFFSLADLIDDVRSATIVKAQEKNLYLNLTTSENVAIYSDPAHLRQILINLIGNAIKFTLQGGVDVEFHIIPAPPGIISTRQNERYLKIWVRDTGVGIPFADQVHLFEPFKQIKRPGFLFGGTGLGLYISKQLAAQLGGELDLIQSTPQGTTFCLTLKCDVAEADTSEQNESHTQPGLQGLKILLAEDAPDNRYLLNHVLTEQGAVVEVAENGLVAVEKARRRHYDVIVMDIQMPVLDGNSATEQLRSNGITAPVIALTACALASEREKSFKCGVNDYLTKPIDFLKLIQTVKRFAI